MFLKHRKRLKFRKDPKGTDIILHIDNLKVPYRFKQTPPRDDKYQLYKKNIITNKRFDKPICIHWVINEQYPLGTWYICDGYIRYLVAKEIGIKFVPCKIIDD